MGGFDTNTWTRRGVLTTIGAAASGAGLASGDQHQQADSARDTVKIIYYDCQRARIVGSYPGEVRIFVHYRAEYADGSGVITYTFFDRKLPTLIDISDIEDRTGEQLYNRELTAISVYNITDGGHEYLASKLAPEDCRS